MKTKHILTGSGLTFGTLRFEEKFLLDEFFGFSPDWDYRPTNAIDVDSPGVYTAEKISNLSTIVKILLKASVIERSIVNGSRQRIKYSFVLDKPPRYKVFCQPESIQFKEIKKLL